MTCIGCNKELIGRNQKKYCSRSCSAKVNNRVMPKRKINYENWNTCRECGKLTKVRQGAHCVKCIVDGKHKGTPVVNQTIEQTIKRGGSNRYDIIRDNARRAYREQLQHGCCDVCGYSKHVELCHIKSISSFPKDTLVSVVNDKSNIRILGPNCHWEFDHV